MDEAGLCKLLGIFFTFSVKLPNFRRCFANAQEIDPRFILSTVVLCSCVPNVRYSKRCFNMKILSIMLADIWIVFCVTVFFLLSFRSCFRLTGKAWIILLNTLPTQAWRSFRTSSASSSPWAPGRNCRRSCRSVFLRNAQSRRWETIRSYHCRTRAWEE